MVWASNYYTLIESAYIKQIFIFCLEEVSLACLISTTHSRWFISTGATGGSEPR